MIFGALEIFAVLVFLLIPGGLLAVRLMAYLSSPSNQRRSPMSTTATQSSANGNIALRQELCAAFRMDSDFQAIYLDYLQSAHQIIGIDVNRVDRKINFLELVIAEEIPFENNDFMEPNEEHQLTQIIFAFASNRNISSYTLGDHMIEGYQDSDGHD